MKSGSSLFGALLVLVPALLNAAAPTVNTVTSAGFTAYNINGTANASLTLYRGETYVFNVSASGHPFWLKTVAITGTGSAYNTGVSNNGLESGTLTFTVPANAPATLFYICQYHSAMKGTLNIVDPPAAPPVVSIVSLQPGNPVVLKSTGVTGWTPVPEYSLGLVPANWTAVPSFTNILANGTNTTTFAPVQGSAVFFRVRQRQG